MRETQQKLLTFLKAAERSQRPFSIGDAAVASKLAEVSIKSYISKKLEGRWVTRVTASLFRAHGILNVTPSVFEDVMSQKSHDSFASFEEWRSQVERLIDLGVSHGFEVRPSVEDILRRRLGR